MKIAKKIAMMLLVLSLAVACTRNEPSVAQEDVETRVDSVWVTNTAQATQQQDVAVQFNIQDTLIAHVALKGNTPARMQVALFYMNDGRKMSEETRTMTISKEQRETFSFKPTGAWAVGRYLLEVKLDNKVAAHREIEVTDNGGKQP